MGNKLPNKKQWTEFPSLDKLVQLQDTYIEGRNRHRIRCNKALLSKYEQLKGKMVRLGMTSIISGETTVEVQFLGFTFSGDGILLMFVKGLKKTHYSTPFCHIPVRMIHSIEEVKGGTPQAKRTKEHTRRVPDVQASQRPGTKGQEMRSKVRRAQIHGRRGRAN